jgi:hypothetical protein
MKSDASKLGFEASPINDNLYKWEVKLFGFDKDTDLAKDLEEYKDKHGLVSLLLLSSDCNRIMCCCI